MQVVGDPRAFRHALDAERADGRRVGLVPTMGALHAGHMSLVTRAVADNDHVAVSIFVNPLQFDRAEDLARYPRTIDADLQACEDAGVQTAFVPSADDMFPAGSATTVSVGGLADRWEGMSRPGHFDGVATVVAKLFSLGGECAAYFGEKDFQQLAVVRRVAADLSMPVDVVGCPTVRDADGLALSSRNVRLSVGERRAATVLWRALTTGRAVISGGEERPEVVGHAMAAVVEAEPMARLDYAVAVDAADLTVPPSLSEPAALRLLVAAEVGPVRLIDNCAAVRPSESSTPAAAAATATATAAATAGQAHRRAARGPLSAVAIGED